MISLYLYQLQLSEKSGSSFFIGRHNLSSNLYIFQSQPLPESVPLSLTCSKWLAVTCCRRDPSWTLHIGSVLRTATLCPESQHVSTRVSQPHLVCVFLPDWALTMHCGCNIYSLRCDSKTSKNLFFLLHKFMNRFVLTIVPSNLSIYIYYIYI